MEPGKRKGNYHGGEDKMRKIGEKMTNLGEWKSSSSGLPRTLRSIPTPLNAQRESFKLFLTQCLPELFFFSSNRKVSGETRRDTQPTELITTICPTSPSSISS
jgi:hypothetical protein